MLVLGIAIATALAPIVNRLSRHLSRTLSVIIVYLLLILVMVFIGWAVIPTIASQVAQFVSVVPDLFTRAEQALSETTWFNADQLLSSLTSAITQITGQVLSLPLTVFSYVLDFLLLFFVSMYWLMLMPSMKAFFLSLFSDRNQTQISRLISRMGDAMAGYLRGTIINGLIVGVLTYFGLLIIGVPFPLVMALIAGVLELLPIIGPVVAGAIIVLFALFQSPTMAIIALIFEVVMQQTENNLLVPFIMKSQTKTSSLLVLFAVIAGGAVGGILGAIVAIPLVAALSVLVEDLIAPAIRHATHNNEDVVSDIP
jgi:predicted PurR-regulated permease PerM